MNYGVSRRRSTSINPEDGKTIEIQWQEGNEFVTLTVRQEFTDDTRRPRWISLNFPWEAWATLSQFVQQAHEDAMKGV